jgi:hypothetical protein
LSSCGRAWACQHNSTTCAVASTLYFNQEINTIFSFEGPIARKSTKNVCVILVRDIVHCYLLLLLHMLACHVSHACDVKRTALLYVESGATKLSTAEHDPFSAKSKKKW